ncbi:MAG: DNA alkylation repair protein [Saccharofermentans sp.]|nr:DNA alkylation repair protein [Saccharofermentans sp.]
MISDNSELVKELFKLQDNGGFRDLQIRTIPNIDPDSIIGVRTPDLRSLARKCLPDCVSDLPHRYFEENQIHAFIISSAKDFVTCISEVEKFLPYVDNWATCDQMNPKVFAKHRKELLKHVNKWIKSKDTYTVRFAIKMLMDHFLEEGFDDKYPKMVASVRSDEYYVQMMAAWYFATALAKQYDAVIPYLDEHRLDSAVHKKTVRKAIESFRVSDEHKMYLRSL